MNFLKAISLLIGISSLLACESLFENQQQVVRNEQGDTIAIYTVESFSGDKTGKQRTFYPGGQRKSEYVLTDYLLEGPLRGWFEDGSPAYSFRFEGGKKVGMQIVWQADGEIYTKYAVSRSGKTKVMIEADLETAQLPSTLLSQDVEPEPLNLLEIQNAIGYPMIARDTDIQGELVFRVLVDRNGRTLKAKVLQPLHPILENAVEAYIYDLKFTPAIQDGKQIPFWVNIPFIFRLE